MKTLSSGKALFLQNGKFCKIEVHNFWTLFWGPGFAVFDKKSRFWQNLPKPIPDLPGPGFGLPKSRPGPRGRDWTFRNKHQHVEKFVKAAVRTLSSRQNPDTRFHKVPDKLLFVTTGVSNVDVRSRACEEFWRQEVGDTHFVSTTLLKRRNVRD